MLRYVLTDIKAGMNKWQMAFYFAWGDLKARYRRSILGPFWLVLGTAIGVAGLGFLWSALLHMDKKVFIPSLTIGLVVWQFISGSVTESTTVFIRNVVIIRNLKIPYFFFSMQLLLRQLINFGHNLLVVFVVLVIFPPPLNASQLLIIPGMFLLIGNLFWISMLLGMLGARFRDLDPLISAFMPMLFFLSPVIYRPVNLGIKQQLVWLNPFAYFISLIRDPIQGVSPAAFVYIVSFVMLIVGWVLLLWLFEKKHTRISFWV